MDTEVSICMFENGLGSCAIGKLPRWLWIENSSHCCANQDPRDSFRFAVMDPSTRLHVVHHMWSKAIGLPARTSLPHQKNTNVHRPAKKIGIAALVQPLIVETQIEDGLQDTLQWKPHSSSKTLQERLEKDSVAWWRMLEHLVRVQPSQVPKK